MYGVVSSCVVGVVGAVVASDDEVVAVAVVVAAAVAVDPAGASTGGGATDFFGGGGTSDSTGVISTTPAGTCESPGVSAAVTRAVAIAMTARPNVVIAVRHGRKEPLTDG